MATGFSALGICHSTSAEALAAYWEYQPNTSQAVTGSANVFFAHYNLFNTSVLAWERFTYRCTFGLTGGQVCTSASIALPTFTPSSCTYTPLPTDNAYDYQVLANVWAFGISIVVAFFVLGRGVGLIVKLFK